MKKITTMSLIAASALLLGACTGSGAVDMSGQSPSFQNGAKAGCDTAKGMYTKDHTAFNNDAEYQNGWFYGRKKCNPADSKH